VDKQTLHIPNISCGHCIKTIETELNELSGVQVTDSDVAQKTITIEWEHPATIEFIRDILKEMNYPAQ
jgi:copper chaperone